MRKAVIFRTLILLSGLYPALAICLFAMPDTGWNNQKLSVKAIIEHEVIPDSIKVILEKHQCLACHHEKEHLVGPSFQQIARKGYSASEMLELIKNPKPSNWPGYPAMPPVRAISEQEVKWVAQWISSLQP